MSFLTQTSGGCLFSFHLLVANFLAIGPIERRLFRTAREQEQRHTLPEKSGVQ